MCVCLVFVPGQGSPGVHKLLIFTGCEQHLVICYIHPRIAGSALVIYIFRFWATFSNILCPSRITGNAQAKDSPTFLHNFSSEAAQLPRGRQGGHGRSIRVRSDWCDSLDVFVNKLRATVFYTVFEKLKTYCFYHDIFFAQRRASVIYTISVLLAL